MSSHVAEKDDERFMQRALALARETAALASPNPQVGCVLVKSGAIIGEGAHRYAARDHAEIVALKQAGEAARGATAYVTLEPCAHHGRTGPCADALISAGVGRVVIATEDPNPLVSGKGIARLRAAGVEVATGILEQPARELNDAFAHFIQHHTPFVTLKTALSADGYLAPPPAARAAAQTHWLTGEESRAEVQRLRHASDAILAGIGTVLADDPALTDRTGLARRRPLLRVVLDTWLRTPPDSQLIATAMQDVLIFTSSAAPAENMRRLRDAGAEVEVISADSGHLNLREVLKTLAARDVVSLLLEAGTHLNAAFLREGLVGKIVLFRAPTDLGPDSVPFAEDISPLSLEQRLCHVTHARFGPDACTTGYLHSPWPESASSLLSPRLCGLLPFLTVGLHPFASKEPMTPQRIRKAVFPAAGLGTRFLPATKAMPKEMLCLVDKPLIQYGVEEAVAAGCTEIIIITGRGKSTMEDHFDASPELEANLEAKNKKALLEIVHSVNHLARVTYTRQPEPLGLGHAVLMAKELINDQPFAVILPDDIVDAPTPCLKQMVQAFEETHCSILGSEVVEGPSISSYGVLDCTPVPTNPRLFDVTNMVEKPRFEDAPSNHAIIGRYILTPRIFDMLEHLTPGAGGELQLTDAIKALLAFEKVYGFSYEGKRHDAGDKLGFLKATVEFALKRDDLGPPFREWLKSYSF